MHIYFQTKHPRTAEVSAFLHNTYLSPAFRVDTASKGVFIRREFWTHYSRASYSNIVVHLTVLPMAILWSTIPTLFPVTYIFSLLECKRFVFPTTSQHRFCAHRVLCLITGLFCDSNDEHSRDTILFTRFFSYGFARIALNMNISIWRNIDFLNFDSP